MSLMVTDGQVVIEEVEVSQTVGFIWQGGKGKGEGNGSGMVWRASRKGIEGESGLRCGPKVKEIRAPSLDKRSLPIRGTRQWGITKKE